MDTWDAVETAQQLAKGNVSRREVVDAAVARAENASALGGVVTATFERAREECHRASGPLAGVPTFVKDLTHVKGVPIGFGTGAAEGIVSKRSDPVARLLVQVGLVSLGKSATPEFGLTATTEPIGRPPARNPWDPSRSSGGSSGGAATLVAAGVVPIAHASDGGGSIRIPAAASGLVGLKPTRGRLDMDGSALLPLNIAVDGVLTRSVRDTVAFWQAVDVLRRPRRPVGAVRTEPGRLRIRVFVDSPLGRPVSDEVKGAVTDLARLCEELGHVVELGPCPYPKGIVEDFVVYWAMIALLYDRLGRALVDRRFDRSRVEPWTKSLAAETERHPIRLMNAIRRLRRFAHEQMSEPGAHDVTFGPVLAHPAPPLGYLATDAPYEVAMERILAYCPYTGVINAAGRPALALPIARSREGLPIGGHFIGRPFGESTLLSLGLQLERAAPWPRVAPGPSEGRHAAGAP